MTREEIIKQWRSGFTVMQVTKMYIREYNKEAVKKSENKIDKDKALEYVERTIFEFETKDWRSK